jgi:hypothetical protein
VLEGVGEWGFEVLGASVAVPPSSGSYGSS